MNVTAPIGVFDSGMGGLSVLRALREILSHERFVYVADSGNAPYGDGRGDAFVLKRSLDIAEYLCKKHHIKALVVACNTATAAAVDALRAAWPKLPIVGIEPALGPAARHSHTHCVGVLATRTTLESQRFQHLLESHSEDTRFILQAGDGLAKAIEERIAARYPAKAEEAALWQLCAHHLNVLGTFGAQAGAMDSLVLGCTHYALLPEGIWAHLAGPQVRIWDCSAAVARQTRRLLEQAGQLAPIHPHCNSNGYPMRLYTTGALAALEATVRYCLMPDVWDCECEGNSNI